MIRDRRYDPFLFFEKLILRPDASVTARAGAVL